MAALKPENYATKDEVKRLNDFLWVGVMVLFIGFAAMFGTLATLVISHFDTNSAAFQSLNNQVVQQNVKLDQLLRQSK
jgi:hypothetical protein